MLFMHDDTYKTPTLKTLRWGALSLLPLLSLALLAGCGGGGGGNGNPGPGTTTGTGTGTQTPLTVTKMTTTNLTASISEPSTTVSVGGTVTYTLTLTNNTASAIAVHATSTPTKPSAVVTVTGPTGAPTFQALPGEPPLINGSLAPGASISTTQTATGFTAAGTYSATAVFSDDTTLAAAVGPLTVTAQ